jgi:peroxiredoxin
MKLIFAFFLSICTVTFLKAQDQASPFRSASLVSGFPNGASGAVGYLNLTKVKYAELKTGLDSLQLFFGSFIRDGRDGYWVGLDHKDDFEFMAVSLNEKVDSDLLSQNVEFKFNGSSMRVSFQVDIDPQTEDVFYQWLSPQGASEIAHVQTLERLIEPNKAMPFFTAETLQESTLSLDDFKGKYLVINWWATSCAPCVVEMPGLNKLVDKYQSRDDVEFLAIAWDSKERLEKFFEKRAFDYQQSLANEEVTALFGESFPKHVVINPEGMVTYFSSGGNEQVHLLIDQHLAEQLEL